MIYWKYAKYSEFILQEWCNRADKTLNDFVTDRGKYDLGFGRDADSTEYRYYCVCRDSYGRGDLDSFHCLQLAFTGDMVCGFCSSCGVDERYFLRGKFHQHYKGGYELFKDWEDLNKYEL